MFNPEVITCSATLFFNNLKCILSVFFNVLIIFNVLILNLFIMNLFYIYFYVLSWSITCSVTLKKIKNNQLI